MPMKNLKTSLKKSLRRPKTSHIPLRCFGVARTICVEASALMWVFSVLIVIVITNLRFKSFSEEANSSKFLHTITAICCLTASKDRKTAS